MGLRCECEAGAGAVLVEYTEDRHPACPMCSASPPIDLSKIEGEPAPTADCRLHAGATIMFDPRIGGCPLCVAGVKAAVPAQPVAAEDRHNDHTGFDDV